MAAIFFILKAAVISLWQQNDEQIQFFSHCSLILSHDINENYSSQMYCDVLQLRLLVSRFDFWVGKIPWRRDRLPSPVFLDLLGGSAGKESACNMGDIGSIPGLGRSSGEGKGYPIQYSGLENSMDCIGHGVTKCQT